MPYLRGSLHKSSHAKGLSTSGSASGDGILFIASMFPPSFSGLGMPPWTQNTCPKIRYIKQQSATHGCQLVRVLVNRSRPRHCPVFLLLPPVTGLAQLTSQRLLQSLAEPAKEALHSSLHFSSTLACKYSSCKRPSASTILVLPHLPPVRKNILLSVS